MAATVRLTVVTGPHRGERFCFRDSSSCVVGRSPECFMCFSGKDRDQSISRRHCLLQIDPPLVRAQDLGSVNGTYINGHSIDTLEADDDGCAFEIGPASLKAGDVVTVGGTSFTVEIVDCPPKLPGVDPDAVWKDDEVAKAHCTVACR